jgi:Carboxypeptidase regulatory-like domain
MRLGAVTLIGLLLGVPAAAQPSRGERPAVVQVVVRDATNLPIPNAHVELTSPGGFTVRAATNERGQASFEGLRPGMYSGRVEVAGFTSLAIDSFSFAAGARVTREVTLQVGTYVERLDVTPSADDRELMNAFSERLTEEQLAALPEDREELARVLRQLAGGDAEIRVNGFSGGRLPLGTQIRDIRIRYDMGAASSGDGARIDIQTSPGGDRWRNNAGITVRDEALSSRNAFSGERPVGQTREYFWSLDAPLVRNRTGVAVGIEGSRSMENQVIRAAVPGGFYSSLLGQPSHEIRFWTNLQHEISPTQSISVDLARTVNEARNRGIGELDLPERAFASNGSGTELQIAHHATLRGRYMNDIRLRLASNSTDTSSMSDGRTFRVLDAFTSGSAQQQGGNRSRTFQLGNNLEFTLRSRHEMNVGANVDASAYSGNLNSNALGTYVFSSLAAFETGQPMTFIQRIGDPTYAYSISRFGWHVRDDYRVRRNVMLNLGLRHEFQTHLRDWVNFSPWIGFNWTPSSKARTTLRAGVLVSHSPLTAGVYGETLLVNGLRQSDFVIANPGYPNPFSAGVAAPLPPPSIIRARADLEMPVNRRYSLGVDQPIGKFLRFRGTLSRDVGRNLFRSRDANAPVDGIRPDPSVLAIRELESTARSMKQSLQAGLSLNYPRRRLSGDVSYTLGRAMDGTDAAFSLPPDSLDLTGEWGPASSDVRHQVNASVNSDLPGRFRLDATFRAESARPYNITTGADANGDGVYSERPAGVTRNSARGAGTKNLDLTVTWHVSRQSRPDGQAGAGPGVAPAAVQDREVFRFEVLVSATNVLNLVNPQNFSGVLTSPFFGLPTSAGTARRLVVGTRAWF